MKKLYLNTKKIQQELDRLGKTQEWLAHELGLGSRQAVNYILKRRPISKAAPIAAVLALDPKDLIVGK